MFLLLTQVYRGLHRVIGVEGEFVDPILSGRKVLGRLIPGWSSTAVWRLWVWCCLWEPLRFGFRGTWGLSQVGEQRACPQRAPRRPLESMGAVSVVAEHEPRTVQLTVSPSHQDDTGAIFWPEDSAFQIPSVPGDSQLSFYLLGVRFGCA